MILLQSDACSLNDENRNDTGEQLLESEGNMLFRETYRLVGMKYLGIGLLSQGLK